MDPLQRGQPSRAGPADACPAAANAVDCVPKRGVEDLIWARETWSGSFQPQTFALSATGAEVGEVNGVGAALDVGGVFTH